MIEDINSFKTNNYIAVITFNNRFSVEYSSTANCVQSFQHLVMCYIEKQKSFIDHTNKGTYRMYLEKDIQDITIYEEENNS